MADGSGLTSRTPNKKMRGFLEIEDEEIKFFTKRFFILRRKQDVLEYYRQDPLVGIKNKDNL